MATIYHYTTAAAFLGMMQNCTSEHRYLTMWATHAMYLNDPLEYQYGKTQCIELLEEIEAEQQVESAERLSELAKDNSFVGFQQIMEFSNSTISEQIHDGIPYVISFSRAKDYLPMWQAYAKQGRGIALGFIQEELIKCDAVIETCYYRVEDEDRHILKEIVRRYYKEITQKLEHIQDSTMVDWYKMECINQLQSQIATFIKHCAYEYEKEVRFKGMKAQEIKYRISNGLLVPYIEQEIPFDALSEIVIGPTLDAERMKNALDMMIYSKGLGGANLNVKFSDVSYRESNP